MAEKYIFVDSVQEQTPIYEMSEEEFKRIQEANKIVFDVYRVEELFVMLIENFHAFNNVILTIADRARLQLMSSDNYFQKNIAVNRAALNFFATLNMYQDYICERIDCKEIGKDFSKNPNIQKCMGMRNYIQHVESFPVISNTSYSQCDLDVMLSSVRFLVAAKKLKIDKLHKGTREAFSKLFDSEEKIDLYEIINCGIGEVLLTQKRIRELPLYKDYYLSRMFLLDMEKKISTSGISIYHPCYYFESGEEQNLKTLFVAIDTIKFIDKNVASYDYTFPIANNFITTAPPDFVKKCVKEILTPALRQKISEQNESAKKR